MLVWVDDVGHPPSTRKTSARSRWQSGVCEPPCRQSAALTLTTLSPLRQNVRLWSQTRLCPAVSSAVVLLSQPTLPLSNRCIWSIQSLQWPSSSSQLWTPAHSSLRPLHVKLPIVVSPNHRAACEKYDGLIQRAHRQTNWIMGWALCWRKACRGSESSEQFHKLFK